MIGIEGRLGQILRNLIANALSFSPPGGTITLRAGRDGAPCVIEVEDQGPGIPENKLDAIFERFYSERPKDEKFGTHSGLGLSISRQIAEAHGGIFARRQPAWPAAARSPAPASPCDCRRSRRPAASRADSPVDSARRRSTLNR